MKSPLRFNRESEYGTPAGDSGYLSSEPFATSVHESADIQQALGASIAHLQKH